MTKLPKPFTYRSDLIRNFVISSLFRVMDKAEHIGSSTTIHISNPEINEPNQHITQNLFDNLEDDPLESENKLFVDRASTPDIFDKILSMEANYMTEGRKEGAIFGLEKGRRDGENLGHRYGASYGEEMGFYIGFTDTWLAMLLQQQWDSFLKDSVLQLSALSGFDTHDSTSQSNPTFKASDILSKMSIRSSKSEDMSVLPPLASDAPPAICLFYSYLGNMHVRNRRALCSLLWLKEHLRDIPMDATDEQSMDKVETVRARFRGKIALAVTQIHTFCLITFLMFLLYFSHVAFASRMGLTNSLGLSQQETIGF